MGSIFFKPKNKKLSKAINITSPMAFRKSVVDVQQMRRISRLKRFRALILAKNRVHALGLKKDLSEKERKQLSLISKTRIPKYSSFK